MNNKYRIVGQLRTFLNDNVLSKHMEDVEKRVLSVWEGVLNPEGQFTLNLVIINPEESVYGMYLQFTVKGEDFEKVEVLKPNVWYERKEWDRNPKKYLVVERFHGGDEYEVSYAETAKKFLLATTTHFMYLEEPQV